MDNLNENWLEDILGQNKDPEKAVPETPSEMAAQDDLELERIVQETIAANWGDDFPHYGEEESQEPDPDATQFFSPSKLTQPEIPVEEPAEDTLPDESVPEQEGSLADMEQILGDMVDEPEEQPAEETEPAVSLEETAIMPGLLHGTSDTSETVSEEQAPFAEEPSAPEALEEAIPENDEAHSAEEAAAETDAESLLEPVAFETAEPADEAAADLEITPDMQIAPVIEITPDAVQSTPEDATALQESGETDSEADMIINDLIASGILVDEPQADENQKASAEDEEDGQPQEFSGSTTVPAPRIRKIRPAWKKGYGLFGIPHILATGIWAAIILFIGVTLGRTVWLCAEDLLALGKTGQEATIIISEDDTIKEIAEKLEKVGLIRYPSLFETFAKLTGKNEGIVPGLVTFDGKLVYDYNALINTMSSTDTPENVIEVTILEGYTCKQIFELLEEKGVCSVEALEQYAAEGELPEYWFLEGVTRGSKYCLEGYLFPDTYEFYLDDEPSHVLEKMLDGFEFRFSDRLKEKFDALNQQLGLNLTFHEVITMSSMVQLEKASDLEGYTIASVFYNRLVDSKSNPNSLYHFLGCDATIDYAEAVYAGNDTIIDTYDTYKHRGLPPSPIGNPGLSSLDAALAPDDSLKDPDGNKTFYYFVLDRENNEHVFAETPEEHEKNLQELGYND